MKNKLEQILKGHQREKSDLQNENQKLVGRVILSEKNIESIFDSLHSVCTIILCLIESTCM